MAESHDLLYLQESRAPRILVAQITLMILASAAMFLLAVNKRFQRIGLRYDDSLIIAAFAFFCGDSICVCVGISSGYGKHLAVLQTGQVKRQLKVGLVCIFRTSTWLQCMIIHLFQILYVQPLFYSLSTSCIRFAVLLIYYHIFVRIRRVRLACLIIILLSLCMGMGLIFIAVFQCTLIRYSWDKSIGGNCLDQKKIYIMGPVISFFLDLVIMVLPLQTILSLQMDTTRKCYTIAIISVGSLTCLSAIIREPYILHHHFSDFSWDHADIGIWTSAEESLGIVCACLPSLSHIYIEICRRRHSRKRSIPSVAQAAVPTSRDDEAHNESQQIAEREETESCNSATMQENIPIHKQSPALSVGESNTSVV